LKLTISTFTILIEDCLDLGPKIHNVSRHADAKICQLTNKLCASTRPRIDLRFRKLFEDTCSNVPKKFSPYVIAMAKRASTAPLLKRHHISWP